LFISEQIIAAHGGTIEVESRIGEGALFRVCLPLEAGA
jgi:signal transduction histidine kinase